MKIMHLASEYPPQQVFGLGRFVRDLAVEQVRQGNEVHVVTNSLSGRDHETVDCGVNVHRVHWPPPPKPPDSSSMVTQFNIQLIERVFRDKICPDADVVNAHDWLTGLAGKVVARRLGALFAVTIHDVVVGKNFGKLDNENRFIGNIEHWVSREADRVICVSRNTREEMIKTYGSDPEKTFSIHNAVSEDNFPVPNTQRLTWFRRVLARDEEKVILYIGRLDREKGIDVLLRAFAQVQDRIGPAKLVIAGKGALGDELRRMAGGMGIAEKVFFAGYVSATVLPYLYRSAQMLVVPSLYEPFGIVALEGMVCGLPLVASATGGLKEIVQDGVSGLLTPPGDVDALAGNLEQVLNDDALASRMADVALRRAREQFSWSGVARRIEKIIISPREIDSPPSAPIKTPTEISARADHSRERLLIMVPTYGPDFHLLESNRSQFKALAEQGHKVVFLCNYGERKSLAPSWQGVATVIDVPVPPGYQNLPYKCLRGFEAAMVFEWDWLVKIDSDTFISGDISTFLAEHRSVDAVGSPSNFDQVLAAIQTAGPPDVPPDCLQSLGNHYMQGFFYAIRRESLRRALVPIEGMASRISVEDATVTAALAATGARIVFCSRISGWCSPEELRINPGSPVIHLESRDPQHRHRFAELALEMFRRLQPGSPRARSEVVVAESSAAELSVVIPVRNRRETLSRLLGTLRNDWPDQAEVIVVDYGGSDDLASSLRCLEWPVLRYIYADAQGTFCLSHARNIGLRAAFGRWVVILDCDLLVAPGFIAQTLAFCRAHPEAVVCGPVYKLMPSAQDRIEKGELDPLRDFEKLQQEALPHRIDAPAGGLLAFPRALMAGIGGYDEEYKGYGFEDVDLMDRLGKRGATLSLADGFQALHQFHGYPTGYNTAELEAANRKRFLSRPDTGVSNANRHWGRLPQGETDLSRIGWMEAPARRTIDPEKISRPAESIGIMVWCDGVKSENLSQIAVAASQVGHEVGPWRWIAGTKAAIEQVRKTVGIDARDHFFEVHSTAQLITQFPRARLVIIPESASHASELIAAARQLGANRLTTGEGDLSDDALVGRMGSMLASDQSRSESPSQVSGTPRKPTVLVEARTDPRVGPKLDALARVCNQQDCKVIRWRSPFSGRLPFPAALAPCDLAIIWNGFHPLYDSYVTALKENGTPLLFSELGWYPQSDTFQLDTEGFNAQASWSDDPLHYEPKTRMAIPDGPGILVILQWDADTQITMNSPFFRNMHSFLEHLARNSSLPLIVRAHPKHPPSRVVVDLVERSPLCRWDESPTLSEALGSCRAVATVNSSSALEALTGHIPVLCFGNAVFRHPGGVLCLDGNDSKTHAAIARLEEADLWVEAADAMISRLQEKQWRIDEVPDRLPAVLKKALGPRPGKRRTVPRPAGKQDRDTIKVKLHCSWDSDESIREKWNRYTKGDYRWNNIFLTREDDYDLFVILNHPQHDRYDPHRTIIFQMEPELYRRKWADFASPDPARFLKVLDIASFRTPAWWSIDRDYSWFTVNTITKSRVMSGITTDLQFLEGHRDRFRFVSECLDRLPFYEHYGRGKGVQGLKSYRGAVADKREALFPYKYTFAGENSYEPNYFTEKIIDAILSECLCFYAGCPNIADFIDPRAYVQLDLKDPEESLEIVRRTVAAYEWEQRLPHIREAKRAILEKLQPLPTIERIAAEVVPLCES
jgi:glycogen synthase